MKYITDTILMVRPAAFGYNTETAITNAYQSKIESVSPENISQEAVNEFDGFVRQLREKGIHVIVHEDTKLPVKPDAVFPNNWISTDVYGNVTLFPMESKSRRSERREDIVESLKKSFSISRIVDLSSYESQNMFLEGTGSMVIDHRNNGIYACVSPRTDKELLKEYSAQRGSELIVFDAVDSNGKRVYHTNVMLCIGDDFAVICDEVIRDEIERENVMKHLKNSGHEVISISEEQMNDYAGNMLMLGNAAGDKFIVMSSRSFESLRGEQIERLEKHGEILKAKIPTIETIGGGSARCMIAEIFLPKN